MYTYQYQCSDFGTERVLTVTDKETGRVIAKRDPFPWGVPVNDKVFKQRLGDVARNIVKEYKLSLGLAG